MRDRVSTMRGLLAWIALPAYVSIYSKCFELAVERGSLHAHKFGGPGNISAKPADLSLEIFPLEYFAGFAQRQPHQMLAAVAPRHGGHHRADILGQHIGVDYRLR